MAKLFVLHVSGDFPDPFDPAKTKVIRTLVDLTSGAFDHHMVSINRFMGQSPLDALRPLGGRGIEIASFQYGDALRYAAPPKGILHRTKLVQLGEWLADYIRALPRQPDLIVAHKLTIEGIAVRRAAGLLKVPFALSIQGDTDTKILAARPDLTNELRKVLAEAAVVFPFTPWALAQVSAKLGKPAGKVILLPCPTDLDNVSKPSKPGAGLVSVFHLKSHRRKNLKGLTAAMALLENGQRPPRLSIIGGGSVEDIAACRKIVSRKASVTLEGAMDRAAVHDRMNNAIAFVLPSLRESFGLVFVEALFAGTPIIYPAGTAVDGYFDDAPFAIAVDARNPRSIAQGIEHAVSHESTLKAALEAWQVSDHASMFKRDAIAAQFARGLTAAINRA